MNLTWALKWDLDDEEGKKGKSLQKGQQNAKEQTQCTGVLKTEMNVAFSARLLCVRYYVKYFIYILFHLITTQHMSIIPILPMKNLKQVLRASNPLRKLEQKVLKDSGR